MAFRELWASVVAQPVQNLPAMWETQVQTLGQEDPLEKRMAAHSSILLPPTLSSASRKEPACQCKRHRPRFKPWVRKIPWRRAWQPTPEFLPGESHGWRNLADCSPQGRKSQTRLKQLSMAWHKFILQFILKSAGPRITKTIF